LKRDASPEMIVRKAAPNPDGWAKSATAEKTEGGRHDTAGME